VKILIVDDNKISAALCCELLEMDGHTAACAYSGSDALRAVNAEAFEVALLDIRLPDLSGTELAAHLRHAFPRMALIAITGFLLSDVQRSHGGAPLFDEVLQKPVEFSALETLLTQIEERLGKQPDSDRSL
jgi:CheY-like chemotaxis protein